MGIDWVIAVPWVNRKRPFISLHFSHGGYQCFKGCYRNVYLLLLGVGRQFSDCNDGHWISRQFKGFWRK